MKKSKSPVSSKAVQQRLDGWINVITNLGKMGKDKRTGAKVELGFLDQATIEALYQVDPIGAKIIDKPAKEMLRKGYCLEIKDDSGELGVQILERAEAFDLNKKLETSLTWARLYGGAAIIVGIKNDIPTKPLNLAKINEIEYLTVIDRFRLTSSGQIQQNPTKPNFGYPEFYQVNADASGSLTRVHHSRVIRFEGVELPFNIRKFNDHWGDSIFSRLFNVLNNYNSAHDSTAVLLQDFSQAVFKMKNLAEMIASGEDELVTKRLALVSILSSVCNALVIQDDEDYERRSTSVAGLPDLLKQVDARLVAAADMPHTIVLGEASGGLGSTGESERTDWYQFIASEQKSRLKPQLNKLLDIFFSEKIGPAKGKIPEKYEVKFHPLKELSQKEMVEIRKAQAESDATYIDRQVLDPDDVAQARFGSGEYSIETHIDMEARKRFEQTTTEMNPMDPEEDGEPIQS